MRSVRQAEDVLQPAAWCSVYGTANDRRRSEEAGIDPHRVKPAEADAGAERRTGRGTTGHDGAELLALTDLARVGRREERAGAVRQFGERVETVVIR